MDYKEFKKELVRQAETKFPGAVVELNEVMKNNNTVRDAILIRKGNTNIIPILYIDQYKDGVPDDKVNETIESILAAYSSESVPVANVKVEMLNGFKPMLQLVNLEKNKERFEEMKAVYKPYMDLAAVVIFTKPTETGTASFIANREYIETIGISEDAVFSE